MSEDSIARFEVPFPVGGVPLLAVRHTAPSFPHYHAGDVWEMNYILGGDGYYFIGLNLYPIGKPMIVFAGPRDIHWSNGHRVERLSIVFSLSYLRRAMGGAAEDALASLEKRNDSNRNVLFPSPADDSQFEFLFSAVIREMRERKELFLTVATQYIATILSLSLRCSAEPPEPGRDYGEAQADLIRGVLRYIDAHLNSDIHLSALSEIAGVTQSYLSSLFNRITGHSVPAYIAGRRVLLARRLLETTEMKVISVSVESGFSNVSNFNRTFKQTVGVAPQQYRKNCKGYPKIRTEAPPVR